MARRKRIKRINKKLLSIAFSLIIYLVYYAFGVELFLKPSYAINELPDYSGAKYIYINKNKPSFTEDEINTNSFESYGDLDGLGRCTRAFANISIDMMPDKERESIGMVKPTGWHLVKYDFVDGQYLYNRCHLIAYQLTGQNANEKNLITCTRSMNAKTMLEFENKVADYIKKTHNHVLYRVTPIFEGVNLLAKGVEMEAYSVEDNGLLSFHVFVYNVEDGVDIDYLTGNSHLAS